MKNVYGKAGVLERGFESHWCLTVFLRFSVSLRSGSVRRVESPPEPPDKDELALWFMDFHEEILVIRLARSSLFCEISRVIICS